MIKKELAMAQNLMKQLVNRRRSEREFDIGDMVYLKVKRFQQHAFSPTLASKLSPKYYDSFLVEAKVGKVAYHLKLSLDV